MALLFPLCYLNQACAPARSSAVGREAFFAYDYGRALAAFRKDLNKRDKNFVLYNLAFASAALTGGGYYDSERALLDSTEVMTGDAGKSRGLLSLISAESIKVFKGEPFEKVMAYLYLGIIYYNQADFENARAAFNKALLMDKQSKEGFREDLRLVYFMLGKCYLKLGDQDNAKIAFRKANERNPKEPYRSNPYYDLQLAKQANLTVVLELGRVPTKYRHGPGASLDAFDRHDYPERGASIYLNGQRLGDAALGLDLFYEAKHRGSSGKDAVQASKGVTRDAAIITAATSKNQNVQAGALLFALANQSQADIRQWELLPGELHLYSGRVAAGLHTLRLDFVNAGGAQLRNYRQVWYYIPVDNSRERVYLFRSGAYKGNGSYLRQPIQGG